MSLFWDTTTYIAGDNHSVGTIPTSAAQWLHGLTNGLVLSPAMLVLTHAGGFVSAVTTVIFYPYVATFPSQYTSALSTGEGLSGALVGLLGLWQRPYAEDVAFSVSTFYVASGRVY
jgi:hypothetical protein